MMVSLTDIVTIKRLVACGNDTVYYEDLDVAAGDMIELTTTGNAIDTSDQLMMFEGFQKCFVVNGANLKVADFINTKILTDDIRPNDETNVAPIKGTILTGGTSEATMIVDYVTAANGAATIYGYVTSGTISSTAELMTGTNASGTPTAVSFNKTAAAPVPKPHWYSWTVYPTIGGISFGTMPTKAYLGCLYRGRAVLSGNPNYPQQWYMSRQLNPWDWAYFANDAQSPIAGGNGDIGQAGDIIRALVPYRDDYIIIGCANSMKVIVGDPAEGGTFNEIDLTRGIFGAKSWCFDGKGNFYFWATDGLCVMPVGFGPIENLSALALPNIIIDEELDPSVHRICLGYDRDRNGLLITITTLATGANSNYFYSLKVNGFFPESYPVDSGVYSLFYYDANDDSLRTLLLGCKCGYIGCFDDSIKNDTIGTSTPINSYFNMPIVKLSEEEDKKGKLNYLVFELAGGASGGTYGDSDKVTYSVYVGDDAETVAEDIRDGAVPHATGVLTGTGRQNRVRIRARGYYLGLKLSDNTASKTFVINRISGNVIPIGKMRD